MGFPLPIVQTEIESRHGLELWTLKGREIFTEIPGMFVLHDAIVYEMLFTYCLIPAPAPRARHDQFSMLSSKGSRKSPSFRHSSSGQCLLHASSLALWLLTSEYPEIELHVSSFSGKLFMTPNSIDPSGLWTKNKTGHQEFVTIYLFTYIFILVFATEDAVNAVGILSVRKASWSG